MKIEIEREDLEFLLKYIGVQDIYITDDYSVEMADDNPGLEDKLDAVLARLKTDHGVTL